MQLGRVVGCVWATIKDPQMKGLRMVVVQPLTPELESTGKQLICLDAMGAGSGELIYWVKGKEATMPFLPAEPPVDAAVVGIVDSVRVDRAANTDAAPPAESEKESRC